MKGIKKYNNVHAIVEDLCRHICSGGSPIEHAQMQGYDLGVISLEILRSIELEKMIDEAKKVRKDLHFELIQRELLEIASHNVSDSLCEDGSHKSFAELPRNLKKSIKRIRKNSDGENEYEFYDKIKSIQQFSEVAGIRVPQSSTVKINNPDIELTFVELLSKSHE